MPGILGGKLARTMLTAQSRRFYHLLDKDSLMTKILKYNRRGKFKERKLKLYGKDPTVEQFDLKEVTCQE